MLIHARGVLGDAREPDEEPQENDPEFIQLGYSLSEAYDLWLAWEKGVMPKAGGYFDQPRRWVRMIHITNKRYNRAFKQAKEEHAPAGDNTSEDALEDILGSALFVDGATPSWERFAQGA